MAPSSDAADQPIGSPGGYGPIADDVEVLADVRASTLPDFARQVKVRLMACSL